MHELGRFLYLHAMLYRSRRADALAFIMSMGASLHLGITAKTWLGSRLPPTSVLRLKYNRVEHYTCWVQGGGVSGRNNGRSSEIKWQGGYIKLLRKYIHASASCVAMPQADGWIDGQTDGQTIPKLQMKSFEWPQRLVRFELHSSFICDAKCQSWYEDQFKFGGLSSSRSHR